MYKPVPPPKPYSGTAATAGNSSNSSSSTAEDQQQQQGVSSLKEQLAAITGSRLEGAGGAAPPPLLSHILVTDQGHFHTHSTKFPNVSSEEDRDHLLTTEHHNHHRILNGIDNPALLDDTLMPSYRAPGGGGAVAVCHTGIPPEGTLAGVLPSQQTRPYESPFLPRSNYRPSALQQQHQAASQQLPAPPQHHTASSHLHPAISQHQPATSQHHPASTQQANFTRETWMRASQGQFNGLAEIHPPQGHLHLNGHISQHHSLASGHVSNGSIHNHAINHLEGQHSHPSTHHAHPNSQHTHPNNHHPHVNGHQEPVNGVSNQNNRTACGTDENHINNAQEQQDDQHKDDKWGSLTRGLAARKYQHLKEKISSKFSRGDKPEDRTTSSQVDGKVTSSQGTNTLGTPSGNANNSNGSSQEEAGGIQAGPSRDSGRVNKLNTSFRKAIHQSSQKTNLQEATVETSLSTSQECASQQGGGLPPHYPRSSVQYHAHHPTSLLSPGHRAPAPLPQSSPQLNHQHQNDPFGHGLANRRSGSYHHLSQLRPNAPSWRSHHYSVENLVDAQALPSDHTYSGPAVSTGRGQPTGGENVGSGGSDSGRGTAGSGGDGRVPNNLDTSLDSSASQRQNNQGHSSSNDSEWVDMTDAELQRIMKKTCEGKTSGGLKSRESLAATPPLPPLSPEASPQHSPQPSPLPSPPRHRKYSLSYSNGLNKPDLLEAAGRDGSKRGVVEGRTNTIPQEGSQSTTRRTGGSHTQHTHASGKTVSSGGSSGHRSLGVLASTWSHKKDDERHNNALFESLNKNKNRVNLGPSGVDLDNGDITSTTDALDLDSMLDGVTEATTDDDATSAYDPDVHLIRKQLEGLEGMYSEVLKLLGGGRRGGRHILGNGMGDLKTSRRRLHGSLSSLPSSIVSSRPGRDKRRVIDDRVRKTARDGGGKSIHKRFQRLESHVVTLARSVAHLSSEMRTQHLMFQEIESIRGELATIRGGGGGHGGGNNPRSGHVSWDSFKAGLPGLSNPGRVKKLTQFFGDEPPLVRIFLRKLGYEKYAGLFEQEKIGMLELPYLTEERLQKIGIPMGPRLRILQEAQGPIRKEGNLSVYVV